MSIEPTKFFRYEFKSTRTLNLLVILPSVSVILFHVVKYKLFLLLLLLKASVSPCCNMSRASAFDCIRSFARSIASRRVLCAASKSASALSYFSCRSLTASLALPPSILSCTKFESTSPISDLLFPSIIAAFAAPSSLFSCLQRSSEALAFLAASIAAATASLAVSFAGSPSGNLPVTSVKLSLSLSSLSTALVSGFTSTLAVSMAVAASARSGSLVSAVLPGATPSPGTVGVGGVTGGAAA